MKFLPLILRNLFRKKIRTTLTVLSIAVALFLYGLLATIDTAFRSGVDAAGADRLICRNKTSLIMPLPVSYKERILQIDGVADVTYASWFGGVYKDPHNFFQQFAIDKDSYLRIYPELVVPKAQVDAFLNDREGAIVGRHTAERFKLTLGQRIPIQGTIFAGTWEFNIRGIYDGRRPEDDTSLFMFRHDYLDERRVWGRGVVGWYIVKVGNPQEAAEVAKAVDARFANSAFESVTEPEKVFMIGFLKQMGNIQLLILSIGFVVLFTLLLVTGNTMAIAVRERTGELAVLKTVGFTDRAVLSLVLVESVAIALIGGCVGVGMAKLLTLAPLSIKNFMPVFYFSPSRMIGGMLLAAAVGLIAGLLPAIFAMRLRIVDALRRV